MLKKGIWSNQANNSHHTAAEKAAKIPEAPKTGSIGATLLSIALILAGLAGNYFNFPIFLDIDFLFGSIFAMLVLQFYGFGPGTLAAAIISGYTYILWNHPYAIIIMTTEVAVVGWLVGKRKTGLVLADTLYWLIIGIPMVYLFFHVVMDIPFSNTFIVMTKQAVNGIANALVARLIFTGLALRSRSRMTSYRDVIYNLLAFFVLVPALILMAISSRTDFAQTDLRIRTSLMHARRNAVYSLQTWVGNRTSAILNLAEMAASKTPQQIQPYLEQAKKSDVNFLRIGLLDTDATITAYFPLLDDRGQQNIGKNFADRPFIPVLKQTLKPMLSEVVMGRIGIPKPMVTMLAPVVIRGEYGGYVTGILSFEQIREYFDTSSKENGLNYTLVDKNGNVILTNRTDQTAMTPFKRDKGTVHNLGQGISQWVPVALPHISITERWKNSLYVAETTIGNLSEWKLILEQPVAPFQKTLYNNYTGKLTVLFLILLGGLILAEVLSRRSIATLEKLRLITHDLPNRLSINDSEIVWPESGIQETTHLINNFREMANSLIERFNEIRRINESLERRVEDRTEKLRESEARWQFALEGTGDGVWDWNTVTNRVYFSAQWKAMLGYAENEIGCTLDEWSSRVHPDDKPFVNADIQRHFNGETPSYQNEHRVLCKDGSHKWILDRGKVIEWTKENKPLRVIGTHSDISDRKRTEAEREQLIFKLKNALAKVKALSGLLPICSNCKKIRDDQGYWRQLEAYIEENSDAQFSHGICRDCAKKLYPDLDIYED